MLEKDGYTNLLDMIISAVNKEIGIDIAEGGFLFSNADEMHETLNQILENLSEKERNILRLHCGINIPARKSMNAIACELGYSAPWVRCVLKGVVKKLNNPALVQPLFKKEIPLITIEQLGMSTHAKTVLTRAGIRTVAELVDIINNRPEVITRLKNCGEVTMQEIWSVITSLEPSKNTKIKQEMDPQKAQARENLLTTSELCKLAGITRKMVNAYIRDGKIDPFIRIGSESVFWKPDIINFLAHEK